MSALLLKLRRFVMIAAVVAFANASLAQKDINNELGFQPGKLYDFGEIDNVNLFNGNLMLTLPIGPRYQVGPALAYQFTLTYNGKIWDTESYDCVAPGGALTRCSVTLPNQRSNAGLGWRLSMGRLIPPSEPSAIARSDVSIKWVYEGPSGEEHAFSDGEVGVALDASAMRLITVDKNTRDVEFPTGEVHRFKLENHAWRLGQMADRFGNWVKFAYAYDTDPFFSRHEVKRTITDSVGRQHVIEFQRHLQMIDSVDRGQNVRKMNLQGFEGAVRTFELSYVLMSLHALKTSTNDKALVPMLNYVQQPDGTRFDFDYHSSTETYYDRIRQGGLRQVKFPTGAIADYEYQPWFAPAKKTCALRLWKNEVGIKSRTITVGDTTTKRTWDYVQNYGPPAPTHFPDPKGDYCCVTDPDAPPLPSFATPVYWARTSVLSPADRKSGTRTRTDHYFDVFSFDYTISVSPYTCDTKPDHDPELEDPFVAAAPKAYGYPGTFAAPPRSAVTGPLELGLGPVLSPKDEKSLDSAGRRLTTQVLSGCSATGDCTAGKLERSTYTSYEKHPLSATHVVYPNPMGSEPIDPSMVLHSTRTVFHDDTGCDGECATETNHRDDNGVGLYRTVESISNFPSSPAVTTTTNYEEWTDAEIKDREKVWITGLYDERTRERGSDTIREQFCFDADTGLMKRHRILAGATPGDTDVLSVFEPTANGDVKFVFSYGGDKQKVDKDAPLCTMTLPAVAWYKVENNYFSDGRYTGGLLTSSWYHDRSTEQAMPFKTVDRKIDRYSGAITRNNDTAGFGATYAYEALPVRVQSVTRDGGTVSSYAYQNATAAKNARVVETITGPDHDQASVNTYEFDGMGRVKRVSKALANGKVAVVETDYDELGRQSRVTQPVEAASHPDSPVSGNATFFTYDAFDRKKSVTAPDGSVARFNYTGARTMSRTSSAVTSAGGGKSDTTTTEFYDAAGLLLQVDEDSGNTSAAQPKGATVSTIYDYDAAGRLTLVVMDDGTTKQERLFEYDGRGFLTSEDHPEQDATTYSEHDARGHAWKRATTDSTLQFTYDSAERLTEITTEAGEPVKKFVFGTIAGYDLGKLSQAIRYNDLPSAGKIEVTENYAYGTASGQMSSRTTKVERVSGTTRTEIQRFEYGVDYDDLLMPKNVRMPTCALHGCSADPGIQRVTNSRSAGYLTSVTGPDQMKFADLTYHPSGMVHTVQYASAQKATDTYSARHGLPRPSRITFTGCTNTKPYFLPGPIVMKPEPNSCGVQITWPAATLCGGAGGIKYKVLRNGVPISACLTETKFVDKAVNQYDRYTYTIVAEGPRAQGGTGSCNGGEMTQIASKELLYQGCLGQTTLSVGSVTASIGTIATFRATLSAINGPVEDEEIVFSLGDEEIGRVRTGPRGTAVLRYYVDLPAGTYSDKIKASYPGGLLQSSQATATLTTFCDVRSYTLLPTSIAIHPTKTTRPPINVNVTASSNCSWKPERDANAFFSLLPTDPQTGQPKTQTGAGSFSLAIDPIDEMTQQTLVSYVTAGFQYVRVEQTLACTYRFEPGLAYVQATTRNTTTSMEVIAPAGCPWTVKTDAPWIHLLSASGTGSGTVTFRVDSNKAAKRLGRLSIEQDPTATTAVNQYGPGRAVCPEIQTNLSGGGSIQNNQNVTMRMIVAGTQLQYEWWVNNRQSYTCDSTEFGDSSCSERTIGPGQRDYPAPGETVTFQVYVYNSCGNVTSQVVSWTNVTTPQTACKVPALRSSTFGTNAWPADQASPFPGAKVTMAVVAEDLNPTPMPPLTYQWYHGLAGDRSAEVLKGTNWEVTVSPHETSYYWVEVTNGCGAQQSRTAEITITRPPKGRAVGFDFTSDGLTDLLWRNVTTGQNEVWAMSGTTHTATYPIEANPNTSAEIQSYGDFDRDGRADLVWRDPVTGQNDVWIMRGTRPSEKVPLETRAGPAWSIGAVADFDNDEHHDVVWHNSATGENEIWFQNEADHDGTWALPKNPGGKWGLHGTADFNGDERPDLFFHDRATGTNSVWLMNDAERMSTASNASSPAALRRNLRVTTQGIPAQTDRNLVPMLVSDMNWDGRPDIVWRNVVTGENSVWMMNGTTVTSVVALEPRSDTNWEMGGGGGNTNADPSGGGTDPRGVTSLQLSAEPAASGSAAAVTATLSANGAPVAQRELVFSIDGAEAARLLTDATGVAQAAIAAGNRAPGTYPGALSVRFPGDATYNEAVASTALVVSAAPASVTWGNPAAIVYGTPLGATQLNATATVAGAFAYQPPAGTVLRAGFNTLNVTFTPSDPATAPVKRSVVIQVTKAPSAVAWVKPSAISYGVPLSTTQLKATSTLAGSFTYTPPAGSLLDVGPAQTLHVTFEPDDANYESSSATTSIDVTKGTQILQWADPAAIAPGEALGPQQLNASVLTSGTAPAGALSYSPPLGTMLPLGVHELTVSVAETTHYRPASLSVDIVVARESTLLQWTTPTAIVYGTPLSAAQLNATATVAGTFTYTPATGTILESGSHRLTVSFTPSDPRYDSASATVAIDVAKAKPVVSWSAPAAIVYGAALSAAQLNANSDTPGVLTYEPDTGTILNAGAGQRLSATFIPLDVRNYEHVSASVLLDVAKAPQAIVWPAPAPIVYGTTLSSVQLNAAVQVGGKSPAGAITYSPAAGTLLQAGAGQVLTASVAGTENYEPASGSVTIDVLKAKPVLAWNPPSPIVYKTLLGAAQLDASANVPGAFEYAPPAGTLLEAGTHTLSARFTPSDTRNYENASASVELLVERANPVLTWKRPEAIVYGTPLSDVQLNATADVNGTFVYEPAAGVILDAGDGQRLSVRFTPADARNYNDAGASTTIDVAKAPQKIVWTELDAIVYGTALSSTQLNARTEVVGPAAAGALTYTPAAGKVLDAGSDQTLTVVAAETPNYLTATSTVQIDVLRARLTLAADPQSKLYGAAVPTLTGVLTGVVNGDPITASYATTATLHSATGTYLITAALVDPKNRLANYDVTVTSSTLTVLPAPLSISANTASKQYSDPLPQLTASFTGFVLGETPAVLAGTLSLQTPAEPRSAPGTYPIHIGGLASTNYAITYTGSVFTVTPEDARATITSPRLRTAATGRATLITISAAVQDISATADAGGDVHPGDIRKATLTFVDRATGEVLCVAPLDLVTPSNETTAVASCSFSRDFGTSLPASLVVGARVGGYYTRDAAADDATLAIVAPTVDFITGGGAVTVTSAAGPRAPQNASSVRFELNLQHDKAGVAKGKLTFAFTRVEDGATRRYELAASNVGSLSIQRNAVGGTASLVGTATLRDVTVPTAPVVVVQDAPFVVTATDGGEPSPGDGIALTLFNRSGGLWLATGWSGLQAAEQRVTEGNIQVHYRK